jgi:hypothetical protein
MPAKTNVNDKESALFTEPLLFVAVVALVGGILLFGKTLGLAFVYLFKKAPEPYKAPPAVMTIPVKPLVIPDKFPARSSRFVSPITPKGWSVESTPCPVTCDVSLQPVFVTVRDDKGNNFVLFPDTDLPFVGPGKRVMMVSEGTKLCLQPLKEEHDPVQPS